MKLWEQGRTARERMDLRAAEDAEVGRLADLDRTDPLPKGPSRLLQWVLTHRPPKPHPGTKPRPVTTPAPAGRPPRRRVTQ